MNKKEFYSISVGIKAAYPRFTFLSTDEEMEFWYTMFKDIDYQVAQNAVMEHISTSSFPPSIAEIRKLCTERCKSPVLSFDEAWGVVQKAIGTYGWRQPQEAYALMDELTASVVKNLGWTQLCQSENPTADRANFREAYEKKAIELQNSMQVPKFVAEGKALLQAKYVPVVGESVVPRVAHGKPDRGFGVELTPEQIESRSRMVEETRRRLLGGEEASGGGRNGKE